MDLLFLCGMFDLIHQDEVIQKTKTYVEYAANLWQEKLATGFESTANINSFKIISAPFLGAYPNAYKDMFFKGFLKKDDSGIHYIQFCNIWGIRNLSRSFNLKKAVKNFISLNSENKVIVVYSPHTPLLEAAVYAKSKDSNIKIVLIVPDLPQYMNLSVGRRNMYDFFKKFDIDKFNRLNKNTDAFVLLTEAMKDILKVQQRKYCVIEGLIEHPIKLSDKKTDSKTIVYTGKLNKSFGVMNLVEAFKLIDDKDLKLIICGSGELVPVIQQQATLDVRIKFLGQVSIDEAKAYIQEASVLVNPRQNNDTYTKYSFPSKIIDYLSSGNAVVAYLLDGMPMCYTNFMYVVPNDSVFSLKDTIEAALNAGADEKKEKSEAAAAYLNSMRTPQIAAEQICKLV